VCAPSESVLAVKGELHDEKLALSILHSKLAPVSLGEKLKLGVESLVGFGSCGPELMVTLGPMVSTVKERLATDPTFPRESVARTSKVCAPSDRVLAVKGELHDEKLALSILHSRLASVSLGEKAKVGVESLVGPWGPESIVTLGPVVSTVNDRLAGGPGLPSASVAWAWKVWGPSVSGPTVHGELHGEKLPPSTRHARLARGSLEEKPNVGVESLVGMGSSGPESIVVVGPVRTCAWDVAGEPAATASRESAITRLPISLRLKQAPRPSDPTPGRSISTAHGCPPGFGSNIEAF